MINKLKIISLVVAGLLAVSAPLFAHHGNAAYDAANYPGAINKYSLALAQFRAYIKPEDADRVQKRLDEARQRASAAASADSPRIFFSRFSRSCHGQPAGARRARHGR